MTHPYNQAKRGPDRVPKGPAGTGELAGRCVVADSAAAERRVCVDARFAQSKFLPPALPATLITRPVLYDRLTRGSGQRLTVLIGSAGAGKSVLLSGWAAARPPRTTCWLSCDKADANPVRFWAGFIEALRAVLPGFGADAAELL